MFDIKHLKDIRRRLGLTQHKFAEQAGVSQSLIAKIESGDIDPSYSNVIRIEETVNLLSKAQEPDAKSIMTRKVISVSPLDSMHDVIALLKKNNISQVPVIEKHNVLGIVSEAGVLEKDFTKIKSMQAKDVMTEPPPVVSEKTKLSVIAALLRQFPIILIRENSHLAGVITKADVLRTVA